MTTATKLQLHKTMLFVTIFSPAPLLLGQSQQMNPARSFPEPDFIVHDAPHKEPPSGVQFGPNGLTIQEGVGTPTSINVLAFSGDGKRLAAGKDFGRVVVWDFPGRSVLRAIATGQGIVSAAALNSDGTVLATGGNADNFSVKLWNVASGKLIRTVKLGRTFVKELRFDPSDKWLAATYNGAGAYVIDSATGSPVTQLKKTHAVRFSKDGATLITGDDEGFAIWSAANWQRTHSIPRWQGFPVLIAVDADRDRLAVSQSSDVALFRLTTGDRLNASASPLPKGMIPNFADFTVDGFLFVTLKDRLWLWDTRIGVCGSVVMYSSGGALSPDGHWLAGSKDDSILSRGKERTDGVWVWDTGKLVAACGMAATRN